MPDVELLPLPSEVRLAMRAYARACVEANLAPLQAENERLAEALRWYAEQAQLCRKFGSEGDAARHALSADGGKRANRALAQEDRNG